MICKNCGKEISDGSRFCPECGSRCEEESPHIIKLKCEECGAMMDVQEGSSEIVCPFCGTKHLIRESDTVTAERIRSTTHKEIEMAKLEHEERRRKDIEKKKEEKSPLRFIGHIINLILILFTLLLILMAVAAHQFTATVIAAVQLILLIVAFLMRLGTIRQKKKNLNIVLMVVSVLLTVPFLMAATAKTYDKLKWPDSGLAEILPDPKAKYGNIHENSSESFDADIDKYSEDKYDSYVMQCKEYGFTVDAEGDDNEYDAYNQEGYKLSLYYYKSGKQMDITLEAPLKTSEITWPNTPLARLLPVPSSTQGRIETDREDRFSVKIANTSIDDYSAYVTKVLDAGFTVDYSRSDEYFSGDDQYGNHVSVSYEGANIMSISIDKTDEDVVIEEPEPAVEENTDTPAPEASGSEVSPDLKQALDEYEAFMDSYIAFMETYSESDDTVSMLSDYISMVSQLESMQEKMDAIDEESMSDADYYYYMEVMSRVALKLQSANM